MRPRTPAEWSKDSPCATVLDKAKTSTWNLPYQIPMEDTDVTPDEVDDSRTHQFIAFCRSPPADDVLPLWLTNADVMRADAADLALPGIQPIDILETSTTWKDCWLRLNADDDRRAITFENAMKGVDWDLASVPTGVYTIGGYTWEPPFNTWSERPGFVKVRDSKAGEDPPAAAITSRDVNIWADEVATIEGCLEAAPGSTYTASYRLVDGEAPPWVPFITNAPATTGPLRLELKPTPDLFGTFVFVRVEVRDPSGASYTAWLRGMVTILASTNPDGCAPAGATFDPRPPCEADTAGGSGDAPRTDDTGTSGATSSAPLGTAATDTTAPGSETSTAPEDPSSTHGCGCTQGSVPWSAGLLMGPWWLLTTKRSRLSPGSRRTVPPSGP